MKKWGWGESVAVPIETPEAEQAPQEAQLFNIADGLERVGSEAMLAKLAQQFFAQQPAAVAGIAALVADGDHEGAVRAAHSAAGAGGLLGFERLAVAAKALEARLKQRQTFADELAALQAALGAAQAALALLQRPEPAADSGSTLDAATRDALLSQLASQIDSYDSLATETVASLSEGLGSGAPALLQQMDEALMNFDFDAAQALLMPLREALA